MRRRKQKESANSELRHIFFLVADGQTETTIKAFFNRTDFCKKLKVGPFEVGDMDIEKVGNDAEVFYRAADRARSRLKTHQKLVVILDEAWDDKRAPDAATIKERLTQDLYAKGWEYDRFVVIVIQPELENWIWNDTAHMHRVFRFDQIPGFTSARDYFREAKVDSAGKRCHWPEQASKPTNPKEALHMLCRESRAKPDAAKYADVVCGVNVLRCQEPGFQELLATLRRWFGAESEISV